MWRDSCNFLIHTKSKNALRFKSKPIRTNWVESSVPPHPKGTLLDWDLMTVEAIWVLWTCHIQETSLRWFELCDMVRYPAGSSHHNIGTLWSLKHVHGQQQHLSRLWCLSDAQLVLRGPKCSKKISPKPLHHHQPEPFIFRMCPCIHVVCAKFWFYHQPFFSLLLSNVGEPVRTVASDSCS